MGTGKVGNFGKTKGERVTKHGDERLKERSFSTKDIKDTKNTSNTKNKLTEQKFILKNLKTENIML